VGAYGFMPKENMHVLTVVYILHREIVPFQQQRTTLCGGRLLGKLLERNFTCADGFLERTELQIGYIAQNACRGRLVHGKCSLCRRFNPLSGNISLRNEETRVFELQDHRLSVDILTSTVYDGFTCYGELVWTHLDVFEDRGHGCLLLSVSLS
jgi:hypothetical protein